MTLSRLSFCTVLALARVNLPWSESKASAALKVPERPSLNLSTASPSWVSNSSFLKAEERSDVSTSLLRSIVVSVVAPSVALRFCTSLTGHASGVWAEIFSLAAASPLTKDLFDSGL